MKPNTLKAIPGESKQGIAPEPGYAYRKKAIPYFEPALIDFKKPSLVGIELAKRVKPTKKAVKVGWFKRLLANLKRN